jgi:hypothetical protein
MERSIEEIIGDNEEISEHTEDTEEEPTEEPVVSVMIFCTLIWASRGIRCTTAILIN